MMNHLRTLNSSTIVPLAATNTIQLTATLQFTPLFDIQHEDIAHAYCEGLQSRLQTRQGPFAVSHLLNYLHTSIEGNWFNQRHEAQLRQTVGFIFGEIHGKVLTPNGTRRPDATTLVTLKSHDDQRGYQAGRLWFFYEATPDERTLTDDELLKRLREYVTDSVMWGDPEGVWSYTVACLLGELSGHLFPLTAQEQQAWEVEYRYWMEAAVVWNACCDLHKEARTTRSAWPEQFDLQQATKGRFALHSQSVQMVVHTFLANIETTRKLRVTHPKMRMKYPWKTKRFYPVHWPAQAVSRERGRVVLPMGRGRASLVLHLDLPENSGACTLVWNRGFELHVCIAIPQAAQAPGENRATVDLGEIHLAAVTTNRGAAIVVSGRGIRSLKRLRNMRHRQLAKKQARCQKYSRCWRKLQRAKNKMARRSEQRVRDLRHRATRQVIEFCKQKQVGTLFIGNPHGVRNDNKGRHHNQRMSQWEYGKDIDYLTHKSKQARIESFTGSERGTSSQCPVCRHKHKPRGRVWKCRKCGFKGHRDVVGSVNMHRLAYDKPVTFPRSVTYLRPGLTRRSSRAGTPRASS